MTGNTPDEALAKLRAEWPATNASTPAPDVDGPVLCTAYYTDGPHPSDACGLPADHWPAPHSWEAPRPPAPDVDGLREAVLAVLDSNYMRRQGNERVASVIAARVRPPLDAITAERDDLIQKVEFWVDERDIEIERREHAEAEVATLREQMTKLADDLQDEAHKVTSRYFRAEPVVLREVSGRIRALGGAE